VFIPRRLDKYLREATASSLVEIRRACLAGRVTVRAPDAAAPESSPPDRLVFEDDLVAFDGASVVPRAHHHYLVLNKPCAVTTTVSDPRGRSDLGPWLRLMPEGVFPVGRLDRHTSGALLFTNDGDFANAILQPGHGTEKLYRLWVEEDLTDADPRVGAFVAGVQTHEGAPLLRAASATVHGRADDRTELHVTLREGKNRQIRKICLALRLHLRQLHRVAIGSFRVDELAPGQWRHLRAEEVAELWSCCGGMARIAHNKIAALAETAKLEPHRSDPRHRLESWLRRYG
jgi:23S rRNA pseudouridine2605 synthase